MEITGAELFVKALKKERVDTIFAYPGGQAIHLFDALYGEDDIQVILPRHEQGLVHAADGYARSTGKVGVCLVTSGPGATNLVTGIATANYDGVSLVCFTGQVPTRLIGKDSFQEVDIVSITRSVCKYAVTVYKREDLAESIKKAFFIARSGKPGAVVVDLPKDVQQQCGSDEYPEDDMRLDILGQEHFTPMDFASSSKGKKQGNEGGMSVHDGQIKRAMELLNHAKRPVFLIGGGVWISHANEEMCRLAEKTGVPVVTTIMGKGGIPSTHDLYVGNIGIHGSYAANMAVSECDVLFAIGTRFNDRITGKIEQFAPGAMLIHVDINPASISKNIAADVPIVADAKMVIRTFIELAEHLDIKPWVKQIGNWKRQYPIRMKKDGVTPEKIMRSINQVFHHAIIATDVGQNQMWATQFLELSEKKQMLTFGGLGTMGYGLPAAIGAKIGNPETDVVAISGDGGMQMNIQEMATAVVYELPIVICILNNGYLGNVRQWQELFFDRRYMGTCMRYRKSCAANCSNANCDNENCNNENCRASVKTCPEYTPDFIKLAESYGAKGIRVTEEKEIARALEFAKNTRKVPMVIEFIIAREENVLPIVPPGSALNNMIGCGMVSD
jgi:acetolactate synthase-1/2/3 large subunit